ncbi:WD repeat-containing protein 63 [Apostichopus japonicus]|uniref:WD repeat-containing protein 63 n=1 Tax=Stichopus japonicus TaxID=307972 RepID=A0A2G8KZZ2_STIJA|nr:WD repeat-containing protein 63 [Apostichopus japonicus]
MADEPVDAKGPEKDSDNKEDIKPKSKESTRPESKASSSSKTDEEKKTAPRVKSAKSKKDGKKTGGKGNTKSKPAEPKEESTEKDGGGQDSMIPLFISSKSQEIFQCVADEHVTEDNPHKLIPKDAIIQDMRERAAVSDFHPVKQLILDYPGDEILLIYDADFKYGQNFVLVSSDEEKQRILNPVVEQAEDGSPTGEEGEAVEEIDPVVYQYVPPEPKEWVSLGSEKEIEEASWKETEQKIRITIRRARREFGGALSFSDRNADDAKDGYIECVPFEDKSFSLKIMELDKDVQAVSTYTDQGSQTVWKHPCNKYTQYAPRELTEAEQKNLLSSETLYNFLDRVTPRFELALQQNDIMDVFRDDWKELGNEDDTFGSKSDNHLKEYQSFTDLQFSRDKVLTCIAWHPSIKGIIAVSCAEKMTYDERVDNSSRIIMTQSLILIWSFSDPIHPQILLEAPEDIVCFKFNPTDPNIIAGGCINGQIVLWDISKYVDRLKNTQRGKQSKKNAMLNVPGFEDDSSDKTPVVRYCASAAIESGHRNAVADIQWLPDHMEVNRFGLMVENRNLQSCQLLTASVDGTIGIWDTRPSKSQSQTADDGKEDNPLGVATTFKHLDLTWKPIIKIHMSRLEGSGDYGPVRVSFQERQGDRHLLEKMQKEGSAGKSSIDRKDSNMGGGFGIRSGSAKEKRQLEGATTKFFVGTEDGELIYADLKLEKDPDSGKLVPPRADFVKSFHDRAINTLQRSPFFKDIVLVVGGWNFSIWKEGRESNPLLISAAASKQFTCGFWSPTRPAVFYLGTAEGNIEVWDLLDRTHEASLSQNISASEITNVYPWHLSHKQQLLAVSDNVGTLHILEVPWTLRNLTHGELTSVTSYFDREDKRLEYQEQRESVHQENKRRLDAEEAAKKIAQPPEPSTEEVDNKMRTLWLEYLEDEKKFLLDLGLVEEKEEPLPDV